VGWEKVASTASTFTGSIRTKAH